MKKRDIALELVGAVFLGVMGGMIYGLIDALKVVADERDEARDEARSLVAAATKAVKRETD